MPKLDYVQQKKLNSADELREILDRLEALRPNIRQLKPAEALTVLSDLDRAEEFFEKLELAGSGLESERGRFTATLAYLDQRAGALLRALGGPAALAAARPVPAPPRERWWWYIHELVAARQQRLWRQLIVIGLVIVLLVGGLIVAFRTVLAPSPEVVARLEAENSALAAADEGNYEEALAAVETGLSQVPGNGGLLLLRGVFQQLLGETEAAEQSYAQAQAGLEEPISFYLGRSQIWLQLGRFEEAEKDGQAAVELDPESARAWLVVAQSLEAQNRKFEALNAYERAGNLALANQDNEVYVLARMAMGRLGMGP